MNRITQITLGSALLLGSAFFSASCNAQDFKQTESGLEYKYIKKGDGLVVPQDGDVAELNVIFKIGDSTIINTLELNNQEPVPQIIQQPTVKGDLMEGLYLMRTGDEMIFRILMDTLATRSGQPKPEWAQEGDYASWEVSMVSLKSQEQIEEELRISSAEQLKKDEEILVNYFKENNIQAQKTESGLYYVMHEEGSGSQPQNGQEVSVNYTGMDLEGVKFDSNVDPAFNHVEPLKFKLGAGMVIKGWDEALALMKKGGKGTFYIPSYLAYGERAQGPIKPNQILIFDIELLDFK